MMHMTRKQATQHFMTRMPIPLDVIEPKTSSFTQKAVSPVRWERLVREKARSTLFGRSEFFGANLTIVELQGANYRCGFGGAQLTAEVARRSLPGRAAIDG